MRTWMLGLGVAALALTGPALSQGQGNKGGGNKGGQGGGPAMKADRGGGNGGGPKARGNDQRGGPQIARVERGNPGNGRGGDNGKAVAKAIKADRGPAMASAKPGNGRADRIDIDNDVGLVRRDFAGGFIAGRGLGNGCPPGLDKKDNGCMPPGQVKNLLGAALPGTFAAAMLPPAMRNWYQDNDDYYYRAGDGFIYRVDRGDNLIDGLIPMMGSGYYALGDPWPSPYNFYNVPTQYSRMWADDDDYYYRYGNGAIYSVDRDSMLVNGIVSLLAGDIGVGSRLPMGYDVYNVPFAYRDRYADSATDWYRYNDGYIYRVDPTTRLVTAVIDALI